MRNLFRNAALSLAIATVFTTLAGCAHTSGGGAASDPASGYYAGNWYGPNPDRPLGDLTCTIVPAGTDAWNATFFATYGGFGEYEVELDGHREGDNVVFGGDVDLGETSGGVFNWNGTIVGDEFAGTYTSKAINGSFKMQRAEDPHNAGRD